MPFALRFAWRDWRSGAMRLLAASLVVAVAAITAVGFFTERVQRALEHQAGEVMGGDLVLVSGQPLDDTLGRRARERGLATARTLTFPSMARAGEAANLVTVKAVGPGYPLRGHIGLAQTPFGEATDHRGPPPRGEAWLDARALALLDLAVGDTLSLGEADFRIDRVLAYEPDRSASFFAVAPHVMINLADVPATGLVGPGSRVRHRLLAAGPPGPVEAYRRAVAGDLAPGVRVQTIEEARPALRSALTRGRQFLALAALVSVILAGVAVAAAARQHAHGHLDAAAVMRSFGASRRRVLAIYATGLALAGLGAGLVGCALGYLAQFGLAAILADLFSVSLPAAGPWPIAVGLVTALVLLAGFALPPLLDVGRVPPARVLRRDLGSPGAPGALVYLTAVATVLALLWWHTGDGPLTLRVFAGGAGACLALAAAGWVLVRLLDRLRGRVGVSWRYGIANIARRRGESVVQLVGFGLGISVLLVLSLVRGDLLAGWRASVPPDAPNHFLINIQPDQREALARFFSDRELTPPELRPMVRARLVAINDRPVDADTYSDPGAQRFAEREFNLSWAADLAPDNSVVAGEWWAPADHGEPLLSVEADFAETLDLDIGDRLRFFIAGEELELRVDNLRSVDWDSFNVNFFTIAPPGVLEDHPATFVTSFYLPPAQGAMLVELMRAFPSVSVIDVEAVLTQVRQVMDRVSLAVQYVFAFTLAAGIMVLLTAVHATRRQRRYESAMLRTLGATRGSVLRSLAAEFAVLGLLAGLISGFAASLVGHVLASQLFEFSYRFNPLVPVIGTLAGLLGIGLTGLAATRSVLDQPPLATLRDH